MIDEDSAAPDLRLLESEQRYQAVIENASDMIQSVRSDGTFEFVNRAWTSALGYTVDDLATMTIWDIIHEDSIEHCQTEFMRVMQGDPIDFFQATFVSKDGRAVPVEGSATSRFLGEEVVATHGFFRDITERLHARELEERTAQLEREEQARYLEKMAALGKLSAGLAHELNNPAAAVQRANAGFRETLKRRDDALHQLADAGLNAACWDAMEAVVERVRLARLDQGRLDPIAISDAEEVIESWLEDHGVKRPWTFAPSLAEAGFSTEDLASIATSVPETALTEAIAWVTETLILGESMEIIAQSSRRINELVQAIKGYSHMDRATEHDADIHEGIENTLIILAHRLGNAEVVRDFNHSLPPIRMYGNTMNQVWTNILDNAIDATDGHGRIIIRTLFEGDRVVVEIEDNGMGIPPDALHRIFEPFYTSKPQGQGTGLGLDTAWRIVTREHGGTITATSEPGQTTFRISLPITPASASELVAV